jgi:hypothetical protein
MGLTIFYKTFPHNIVIDLNNVMMNAPTKFTKSSHPPSHKSSDSRAKLQAQPKQIVKTAVVPTSSGTSSWAGQSITTNDNHHKKEKKEKERENHHTTTYHALGTVRLQGCEATIMEI